MNTLDSIDRTNFVVVPDHGSVLVAPASLAAHGLRNGQRLTVAEWDRLCWILASEWMDYVTRAN